MKKHLTRQGNSAALIIDKGLLQATGIDLNTELEISTDGDVILINPVRQADRRDVLKRIMNDAHARYTGVFKRLAE